MNSVLSNSTTCSDIKVGDPRQISSQLPIPTQLLALKLRIPKCLKSPAAVICGGLCSNFVFSSVIYGVLANILVAWWLKNWLSQFHAVPVSASGWRTAYCHMKSFPTRGCGASAGHKGFRAGLKPTPSKGCGYCMLLPNGVPIKSLKLIKMAWLRWHALVLFGAGISVDCVV